MAITAKLHNTVIKTKHCIEKTLSVILAACMLFTAVPVNSVSCRASAPLNMDTNKTEIENENIEISSETTVNTIEHLLIQDNVSGIESETLPSSIETEIPNNENLISPQSERIGSSTIPPVSGGSGPYFLQVIYVNYDKTEYTYGPRIASSTTTRRWYYDNRPEIPSGYELKGWQSSHYHGTNSFLTKSWWRISGSEATALLTTNQYNQTVMLNSGEGVYLIYQNIEAPSYSYKLTWDYNGGKVGDDTERTKIISNVEASTYTFYEDTENYGRPRPTRNGYTFTGWIYKNNDTYTGGKFNISNGQINMTGINEETVSGTLIAQWNYNGPIPTEDIITIKKTFVGLNSLSELPSDFFIEWEEIHTNGIDKVTKILNLDNAYTIDEENMILTWKVPHYYKFQYMPLYKRQRQN